MGLIVGHQHSYCIAIRPAKLSIVQEWTTPRNHVTYDDVIKWKHLPRSWPFVWGIHRSPVNSPHKGQRRGGSMFSLIYAWINGWVTYREAADLGCHCTHYDVIVTICEFTLNPVLINLVFVCKRALVIQRILRAVSVTFWHLMIFYFSFVWGNPCAFLVLTRKCYWANNLAAGILYGANMKSQ